MFELRIEGHFSAAHQVKGYPGDCAGVHGHTYRVEITTRTCKLDKLGMAVDFRKMKQTLDRILKKLDHTNLNTLPFFNKHNATAEWLAVYIFQQAKKRLKSLSSVSVWEGLHNAVTYYEK
jgi:6-pyruvoyltetrahydropterin/6-carboxytetrahydropterin synthase